MLENLKDKYQKRDQLTEQLEKSLAIRDLIGLSHTSMEVLKSQIRKPSGVSDINNPEYEGFILRIIREDGSYTDRPLKDTPRMFWPHDMRWHYEHLERESLRRKKV
jgi:hypothetical protein